MTQKKARAELTVLYLTTLLLLEAISGYVGWSVSMEQKESYPNLYHIAENTEQAPVQAEKVIYLTFDDGPSTNTEKVLDALKKYNAKATFFVTAQNSDAAETPLLLQRIAEEGHTIGLHSYSHRTDVIYQSLDCYLEDINRLNEYLTDILGIRPCLMRFPGGSATVRAEPETMKAIILEMARRGYPYYDWDVVSGDDKIPLPDANTLADQVIQGVEGRESTVVLMHDNPTAVTTPQAVEQVIQQLSAQGYEFLALDTNVPPPHIQTTRFSLD